MILYNTSCCEAKLVVWASFLSFENVEFSPFTEYFNKAI